MKYINFTTIVLVCFAAYILHTTYTIYTLFKPPQCKGGITKCIEPYFDDMKPLLKQKFTVNSLLCIKCNDYDNNYTD